MEMPLEDFEYVSGSSNEVHTIYYKILQKKKNLSVISEFRIRYQIFLKFILKFCF